MFGRSNALLCVSWARGSLGRCRGRCLSSSFVCSGTGSEPRQTHSASGPAVELDIAGQLPQFTYKTFHKRTMEDFSNGWQDIGGLKVYAWSVSGLDTSIVTRLKNGVTVAFDMGYSTRQAVKCQHVFVSHGHMDHVSGLFQHVMKRRLVGLKSATYYVPEHLVDHIKQVAHGFGRMHESSDVLYHMDVRPVGPGDTVKLPQGVEVQVFPTVHRVPSQGYLVYQKHRKLKAEFVGMPGAEIGALIKKGVEVHDITTQPELAYTGDTTFEIYHSAFNPDLLKVKLLITEATYIDNDINKNGQTSVEKAQQRGHTHLQEMVDNAGLFENVENILLVHFSDKYSVGYIKDRVYAMLPDALHNKVHISTLLKEMMG